MRAGVALVAAAAVCLALLPSHVSGSIYLSKADESNCLSRLWRMRCIPWTINMDDANRATWEPTIVQAMAALEEETTAAAGVTLPHFKDPQVLAALAPPAKPCSWIEFVFKSGDARCSSPIGRDATEGQLVNDEDVCTYQPTVITLSPSCEGEPGTIIHEAMHALGVYHEHQRDTAGTALQWAPSQKDNVFRVTDLDQAIAADSVVLTLQWLPFASVQYQDAYRRTRNNGQDRPVSQEPGEHDFESVMHYDGILDQPDGSQETLFNAPVGRELGQDPRSVAISDGDRDSLLAVLTPCDQLENPQFYQSETHFLEDSDLMDSQCVDNTGAVITLVAGILAAAGAGKYYRDQKEANRRKRMELRKRKRDARRKANQHGSAGSSMRSSGGGSRNSRSSKRSTRSKSSTSRRTQSAA